MSPLDIAFFIILGFFIIKGLLKGIILESFTLIGVVAGYVLALREMGRASGYLQHYFSLSDTTASIAGFILVFLLVFICLRLLAHLLIKMIRNTPANTVDKWGGALFGALKGMLICGCVAILMDLIPVAHEDIDKIKRDSFLISPAREVARSVFNVVRYVVPNTREFTEEWKEGLSKKSREVQNRLLEEQMKSIEEQLKHELE